MINRPDQETRTQDLDLHSTSSSDPPRNYNLSFSFNFDLVDVNTNDSTDSESPNLQIDVSEWDDYEPPVKRKRESIQDASSVLDEMEEEIERQLDAKAAKTNLTATNVKNILKHVIRNEHVMAMVKKRLHDKEEDVVFEPKLTRAKAKELAASQINILWPITPIKKTTSEVQALIEEELSEDSSDEEYNPDQDKQSDDEKENCMEPDAKSEAVLKASDPSSTIVGDKSTAVQYDPEGTFKVPETPCIQIEEDSIGHRTRSKLCLSETPLEQIEQAFIPPDITTDMYDWDGEVDEDWDNFLKEFTRPLTQEPTTEDDPEADPEYNILEDEETDFFDKEELRADKAVKVTRKELNNLIAELFEFTDSFSQQQQETSKKRRIVENVSIAESTAEIPLNCTTADLPLPAEPEVPKLLNLEQRKLLSVQLCQHVQLMAQHYTMTYMHPEFHSYSDTCKRNLNSLKYLITGPESAFNAKNLPDALKLISDWEDKFKDEKFHECFIDVVINGVNSEKIYNSGNWCNTFGFHPELQKLFLESKALMCPQLLPHLPFRSERRSIRYPYFRSEEYLIALGLEQFVPFAAMRPKKFKGKKIHLVEAVQLITQYMLPCRAARGLLWHIHRRRFAKDANPIKHYFEKGNAPQTIHCIPDEYELKAPKHQPFHFLPPTWQDYIRESEQKLNSKVRKPISNLYNNLGKNYPIVPKNHPLRNPIVNAIPKVITTNNNQSQLMEGTINVERHSEHPGSSTSENTEERLHESPDFKSSNAPSSSRITTQIGTQDLSNLQNTLHTDDVFQSRENLKTIMNVNSCKKDKRDVKQGHGNRKHKTAQDVCNIATPSIASGRIEGAIESLSKIGSRQVRIPTPRLAKTKSAQNMKLMAQVLGPKGMSSNCSNVKSREKLDIEKTVPKPSNLAKVDDEDEIAELMLASTTIKKDSLSRKKAKEARDLENIKRLLESENPSSEEERELKFAASYFQKLHLTLEPHDLETFRTVLKLYAEYSEKLDRVKETTDSSFSDEKNKDALVIELYKNVCVKLRVYPELCSDFLLFLNARQAAMIDKSAEFFMLHKMNKFVNVAQVYFAKQPSRIAKMMQAITQLSSDTQTTLESVHAIMAPILKGHPLIMDLFLQVLPTAKPPESLFSSHLFENLMCPLGPHDKNKTYAEDAPELYESIDLPGLTGQDDPYGGENCKCNCHNIGSRSQKPTPEHCVSCGVKYLNGRIYLQTVEGLRPAKVIFPGAEEEKLENIARVSLKTTDKFTSPAVPKRRRKSSKNETTQDDICHKTVSQKGSPAKETDNSEKSIAKSRKSIRTTLKSAEYKKSLKRPHIGDEDSGNLKKIRTTQHKNKRERKIDSPERAMEIDAGNILDSHCSESDAEEPANNLDVNMRVQHQVESIPEVATAHPSNLLEKSDSKSTRELVLPKNKPWTRQEDAILLQNIKKEYSENSLIMVSRTLSGRTLEEVKERCRALLSLLEKML